MAPLRDQDDEDLLSATDSEEEDGFDEDMEALRRACMLTGTDPAAATAAAAVASDSDVQSDDDDEEEDDLELLRSVQKQFSVGTSQQPLSLPPLWSLPPSTSNFSDDDEDDFETLRVIQRRFASYSSLNKDTLDNGTEDSIQKPKLATTALKDTSNHLSTNASNGCEDFLGNEVACIATDLVNDNVEMQSSGFIEWHQSDVLNLPTSQLESSSFPKSANMFFDAIKKNRSCQKLMRSKLIHIEARIEENKKLKERVKILKDFQATCRRRTGVALSQKKDPRVQLISAQKPFTSNNSKIDDKKVTSMYCGPAENSHVGNYRMALTKYPLSLERKKWSDVEKENLGKGIRQQFQEMMLQISMDRLSHSDVYAGESNNIDSILATIKDHEITSEQIREFLPKVNWDQLASMYVTGRSGAECEARWLNCEDPLINHGPWTPEEDKDLLLVVQEIGIGKWFNIAASLRTNRTPFQCLARYQRSLNASILKREWTEEEDDQLRTAVETFGEKDWQTIASTLEGRTGTQCSNRWKKSLHPSRQRTGRWALDEDKRLKVAVMLFGPKNWKKVAQFVPGRTQVQCRERWVNSLDPSLKWGEWTEEEDSRLREAIVHHGYCWSKVAACVPPRTDSQCSRRWKVLLPDEVPLLRAAKKIKKAAFIGNFVDRESERPALGPKDFISLATCSIPESEAVNSPRKPKRKPRVRTEPYKDGVAASCNISTPKRSRRVRKGNKNSQLVTTHGEVETLNGSVTIVEKETGPNTGELESTRPDIEGRGKPTSHSEEGECGEQGIELGMANVTEASNGVTTSSKKKKRAPKKPSRSNISNVESGSLQNQLDMDSGSIVLLPPDCLELGTVGGCGIEALNGVTTNSKWRKRSAKRPVSNLSTEESGNLWKQQDMDNQSLVLPPYCLESGTTSGSGATTSSNNKKRGPKNPLKSNLNTETSGDLQNQQDMHNQSLMLPADCLKLRASCSGFDASHGATTTKKNKKASKKPPINTARSGDLQNHKDFSETFVSPGTNDGINAVPDPSCPQSPSLMITNGEVVKTIGEDVTDGGKLAPKLDSRRKMCKKLPKSDNGKSSIPVTGEVTINDSGRVESTDKIASSEKHCILEEHHSGNNVTETSAENQDFASIHPQKGLKKRKLVNKSLSNQNREPRHIGDDDVLACFIPKTSKRSRLDVPKCASHDCSDLHSILNGASEEHQMLTVIETSSENQDFAPIHPQKGLKNLSNHNKVPTHMGNDDVLACFIPKTSKKSRLNVTERANQGCSGLHSISNVVSKEPQMLTVNLNSGTKIDERSSRLNLAERTNQGCSGLHSISNGASEESQMLTVKLNSETKIDERLPKDLCVYTRRRFRRQAYQTCCNGGAPESSSCHKAQEPGSKDLETAVVQEPVGELIAGHRDDKEESDNITIATFLKKLTRHAGKLSE